MPTALITGASSGLGAEFARQLAAGGTDLVLVARDEQALERVAEEARAVGRSAEVLVADLTDVADVRRVADRIASAASPVDLLVNNAGYGLDLDFATEDIEAEAAHLRIHVETPLRLSRAALGAMLRRGGGRIVNVASVAGFMPRGTYGAAKRYLIDFSRWVTARYGPRGVTMTAICPGFTHTSFHERLGLPPGQEGVPGWMWLDAPYVVRVGLRDAMRGRAVSIPSFRYRALTAIARILPARLIVRAAERGR